jgi:hypothetical protein
METTSFVLRCESNENSGIRDMTRQSHCLDKAKACADAAREAHESSERVELLQLSQRFMLLAEHAARSEEHGTHREDEQRVTPSLFAAHN